MPKRIRRRERRAPIDGQLGLELGGAPRTAERTEQPGPVRFKEGEPVLYLGMDRLDSYLKGAGLEWVVVMRVLLDELDVSKFVQQYSGKGRHPYHPRVILGLILYGMMEKKWSLRELESLAARDVGAWWICRGLRPDHTTIARFLTRHESVLTEEFFVGLTQMLAKRLGLKNGHAVVDGTVVEAAASHLRTMKAEALKQATKRAEEKAAAAPDDAEAAHEAQRLGQALQVAEERDAARKQKNRLKGGSQVAPAEPEAVVQRQKNGSVRPSYKPSTCVHESGLVTGVHVEPSSETAAVAPLIEQHRATFSQEPTCTMMDAGYFSAFVLSFFVSRDLDVLCPSGRAFDGASMTRRGRNKGTRFLKNDFTYDEERDVYVCPARRLLVLEQRSSDQNGPYQRYRGESCADCPLKEQCTRGQARTIKRYEGDELKEAMAQVMRQPRARERFRSRSAGERPFAGVKQRQGLTRFRRRGLRGARLESVLHFAAWNLRLAAGAFRVVRIERWGRPSGSQAAWRRISTLTVIFVDGFPA